MEQLVPAQDHGKAGVAGEITVIVSPAVPQPITEPVTAEGGNENDVKAIPRDDRTSGVRLWNAKGAGD